MAGRQKGFHWTAGSLEKLQGNVRAYPVAVNRAITAAVEYGATRGESAMRANAPWTDRTGNARGGLFTVPVHEATRHRIIFSHGVPYGIWLEVTHSGRYQIIMPTVVDTGREVMALIGKILGGLGT